MQKLCKDFNKHLEISTQGWNDGQAENKIPPKVLFCRELNNCSVVAKHFINNCSVVAKHFIIICSVVTGFSVIPYLYSKRILSFRNDPLNESFLVFTLYKGGQLTPFSKGIGKTRLFPSFYNQLWCCTMFILKIELHIPSKLQICVCQQPHSVEHHQH